jgi:3-mercaptopyruvate sulfurtransferase SseA
LESLQDIPKDETIVVYCSIGARSQDIGKKLKSAGYKEVYNLYGGIFHWVNEDYPVYKNEEETDEVHAFSKIWGFGLKKGRRYIELSYRRQVLFYRWVSFVI